MIIDISVFESFFLRGEKVSYQISRRGEQLLSLPASIDGAAHAITLYRPQRIVARLTARVMSLLIGWGLHRWFLRREEPVGREPLPAWDFSYSPETVGILLGSSQHRVSRAIASYRGADGWEVAKLGYGPEARSMLRKEAEILQDLTHRGLNIPPCLGLHELGEMTIMRMPYLTGDPVRANDLEGPMSLLELWMGDTPPRPICQFPEWQAIRSALETSPCGREALEVLSGHLLRPVISHGDFAQWNLLHRPGGQLLALDWEWGGLDGMPGLDLVQYFAQEARLVMQLDAQDVIRKVEAELEKPRARDYLVHTGWGNHTIELIMTYAAYKQGVKHQKNPELLAACLESFHARRSGAGARGDLSSPVRKSLRISIVTPSYKQIDYLKNCVVSVADQAGDFKVDHLIQDGGSGPEFDEWAAQQCTAVCVSEKDDGMYDAINRGFRKATGDIIAWLNCDEQYLPGTLQRVADFFNANPDIDILFGDVVLVDEKMIPLAYRMAIKPDPIHIRNAHLSTFSAATFVRRRVLEDGHFLQSRWKTIADAVWIEELLEAGYQAAVMNEPMAVFCMLGSNLGQSETLFHERKKWEIERGQTSWWKRKLIIINHRLKKLHKGAYYVRKSAISVFTEGSNYRTTMTGTLSGRWNYAISQSEARRNERDGKIKTLARYYINTKWFYIIALEVVIGCIYLDSMKSGDAIKSPAILLIYLLIMAFFNAKVWDMIIMSFVFFLVSLMLLSKSPLDVIVARMATFTIGAILAILWTKSIGALGGWMDSIVTLIRRMPIPIILSNKDGKIVLVNKSACSQIKVTEDHCLDRTIHVRNANDVNATETNLDIRSWQDRTPQNTLRIFISGGPEISNINAHVISAGSGRYRFYVFFIESETTKI